MRSLDTLSIGCHSHACMREGSVTVPHVDKQGQQHPRRQRPHLGPAQRLVAAAAAPAVRVPVPAVGAVVVVVGVEVGISCSTMERGGGR